jgi:pimeloyl-ACP methyl ester carboxylesterase
MLVAVFWWYGRPSGPTAASSLGETLWLTVNGLRLKTKIHESAKGNEHPVLVVVLHGDAPGLVLTPLPSRAYSRPSYQYRFALEASQKIDNVVVAAILRPGHTDDTGEHSEGRKGMSVGDNYTPEVVDAVAGAIDQLKMKFHPAASVLVGHSGGAAITGDVIGRWPSEVNGALLVSCPCDVGSWRMHMFKKQVFPMWLWPVKSLSPLALADKVAPSIHVRMVVGSKDDVTPVNLTEEYAEALRKRGDDVQVTIAPGLPHMMLLEPVAYEQLKELVQTIKSKG